MLRLGIIGAGGIASLHTHNIRSGKCPEVQLTAMADRKESRREWIRATVPDAAVFCEGSDLIASDTCDAVLIATPHYLFLAPPDLDLLFPINQIFILFF